MSAQDIVSPPNIWDGIIESYTQSTDAFSNPTARQLTGKYLVPT